MHIFICYSHFYVHSILDKSSTDYVTTADGFLTITTRAEKTFWKNWDPVNMVYVDSSKNYTSGMIQSWNKFCFTGGALELSVQLPGNSANASGLWPAAWLMGNLARATFQDTTTNVWPWSYDTCGNISDIADKQMINACNSGDLPSKYGLNSHQGRGSPEIDIFEVMMGHEMPVIPPGVDPTTMNPPFKYGHVNAFMSTSLQVAPGIGQARRPVNGVPLNMNKSASWYPGLHLSERTSLNYEFYGEPAGPPGKPYMEDSISANTVLSDSHFTKPHTYRLEWQPGPTGYIHWYLNSVYIFGIEGSALQNATGAMIPEEPSYLILNTAVSHVWGFPEPCDGIGKPTCSACWECYDCTNPDCQCSLPEAMRGCKNLPAVMKIDYIRLYQDLSDPLHSVGCSPVKYPTSDYIASYAESFADWSPLQPKWYSFSETLVRWLVIVVLIFSLLYSGRYLLNPQYRTIGDVHIASKSVPTSPHHSPSVSSTTGPSRTTARTAASEASETTSLLQP